MSHLTEQQLIQASKDLDVPAVYLSKISPRAYDATVILKKFVEDECIPADVRYIEEIDSHGTERWDHIPRLIEPLKARAKQLKLWNLFLTHQDENNGMMDRWWSPNYTNLEYAIMAKHLGRSVVGPEVTNTMAPDTGNMEILNKFGTAGQKAKWLKPLLAGEIRSAFAMTERNFSSSNALNISTSARRQSGNFVINGTKWFISGAGDPRCKVWLAMVKTDPDDEERDPYRRHSMLVIDVDEALASGKVVKKRPLTLYGIDDAPHGHLELEFNGYELPATEENVLGGIGDGFKIIQSRLGPGRLHHTMRLLGVGKESFTWVLERAAKRKVYDKYLKDLPVFQTDLAKHKINLRNCENLCYNAAYKLDLNHNNAKLTIEEISMAKIYIPKRVLDLLDWGVQMFGAEGISQDTPLARMWIQSRTLRIADGPDEVHLAQLGKNEVKRLDKVDEYFRNLKAKQRANKL